MGPQRNEPNRFCGLVKKNLSNFHQCFLRRPFIPRAHWQEIALMAPETDTRIEHAVGDLLRDDFHLTQVFDLLFGCALGEMPNDFRRLFLDEHADRCLLYVRLGQPIDGQLVREEHVVLPPVVHPVLNARVFLPPIAAI
jgi:hypothetical protein